MNAWCICLFIAITIPPIFCNDKIGTSLKNMTEMDEKARAKSKNDENPMKKDIKRYLRECGADVSDEDEDTSRQQNTDGAEASEEEEEEDEEGHKAQWVTKRSGAREMNKKKGSKNKGTYPSYYGNSNNKKDDYNDDSDDDDSDEEDDDDDYEDEDSSDYGDDTKKGRNSRLVEVFRRNRSNYKPVRSQANRRGGNKRGKKRKHDDSDEDDSDEGEGCNKRKKGRRNNKNGRNNRNKGNGRGGNNKRREWGYGRYGSDDNYGYERYDPYGSRFGPEDFGTYDPWNPRGYGYGYGGRLRRNREDLKPERYIRTKRSARDDDVQCLSQCVFGYLEMLDDNRVPSETAVTKYFQNNIPNSSIRMKTIREARKCFAKLVTSDSNDGCEFSKELAKCLKLDIER